MTRKLLMITTAIAALAVAPAAFAQGTGAAGTAGAGVDGGKSPTMTAPSQAQMPAPTTPSGAMVQQRAQTNTTTTMTDSTMPKTATKSTVKNKAIHKTSASTTHRGTTTYRQMNDREVQMTRELNRQAMNGGVPAQSAMAPATTAGGSPAMPMMGQVPAPANEAGATGPGNQGDNPTTSK